MSSLDKEDATKNVEPISKSKYENLNNNKLKFKKKNPSELKPSEYDSKEDYHSNSSSNGRKHSSYSRNHRRNYSRSRSRSYSKYKNSPRYRYSNYKEEKKSSEHHHHHHRRHRHNKRNHDRDYSSNRRSQNRYKDNEEEYMRRQLLKTNSINAFLQGKSSNIFYDDNYLPLSSNPYKYLGKPGLEDNNSLEKFNEIPISSSDVSKKDVELYVINLPSDLTEDQIKELLNTALISIEANDKIGNPIVNVRKGKNGKFFILEFRTPNECKNAMNLNGMKILNRTLKIGQPNYLNENEGNNLSNNIANNRGEHDLFPILSSFEKEFDYRKGIINNSLYNYQNIANNLMSGQNSLYTTSSLTSNILDKKPSYNDESLTEKNQAEPGTKLHIMNLPENFDENDIIKLFKTFGKIRKIELLNDEQTNKFNGQCYLEYENEKSYQDAINYGTCLKLGNNFLLINRVTQMDNNKINSSKINYIHSGNYKSNSSLGMLASSVNLGTILKQQ